MSFNQSKTKSVGTGAVYGGGLLRSWLLSTLFIVTAISAVPGHAQTPNPADVGPDTEKRFPSLKLPPGFKATLFACDPLVEYPSVIAVGPEPNSLFVAHDYTTGLGIEIVRRDEIRIVRDTDGDGYADTSTLYAGGFNSIQGLAYHAGTVYVMHAPLLTSLRDSNGGGIADERRDLLTGLGLPPEKNPGRLHCANGVVVGHDGWLYLAHGDRGCDVQRPEGDRLLFQAGGILRCRPDGRDLHVFATGLRNIYDIALDAELNVFVRDNENDGGDYMIRVCHSFYGANHGYPYLYYERPDEAMPPLADLGRGSSAGGTSYLETAFPKECRESLFFCEWGRAVVRYRRQRIGSGFASMQEVDFAAGAETDPYGFKPTDLVVDRDGSLLISDWADGQRPKRGRGRIYRITYPDRQPNPNQHPAVSEKWPVAKLVKHLDAKSHYVRVAAQEALEHRGRAGVEALKQAMSGGHVGVSGRLHAVWVFAHVDGGDASGDLFRIAETDSDSRVRAQAVRALADLTDPILTEHRLAAGRGNPEVAVRLSELAQDGDSRVVQEVVVALGRLRWSEGPQWLRRHLKKPDSALAHAAMQLLRRADNWSAVLQLLDEPSRGTADRRALRALALRAIVDRVDEKIVDGLMARLKKSSDPRRREEYADALARVHRKPKPWSYWGFRPAPRPANSIVWDGTERIQQALDHALADADRNVRSLVLKRMRREKVPLRFSALSEWLQDETDADRVAQVLDALTDRPAAEVRGLLENTIRAKHRAEKNQLTALAMFIRGLDLKTEPRLLEIARTLDEGPVQVAALRELGGRPKVSADRLLLGKLDSSGAEVRAAAVDALTQRQTGELKGRIVELLGDRNMQVRRSAAVAAGRLDVPAAAERLLALASAADRPLRRAALVSLRQLGVAGAVSQAVAALDGSQTQSAALSYLASHGGPMQLGDVIAVTETNRSMDILMGAVGALTQWQGREPQRSPLRRKLEQAVARVQGDIGVLVHWSTLGPVSPESAAPLVRRINSAQQSELDSMTSGSWQSQLATGTDAAVRFSKAKPETSLTVWLAVSDVSVVEPGAVELLASSSGTLQVWLNGRAIYHRDKPDKFQPDFDRFEATMTAGLNRLLVKIVDDSAEGRFHLRFRRISSKAEHEQLTRRALEGRGNVERGRELFLKTEKSLCLKCHRLGLQGERIGPELTGIGSRFSRIHLIESLLEPSRTVAPSYGTVVVVLSSGRVITGVKVSETDTELTLGDAEGKTHKISKSDIDVMQVQTRSTMPEGLEKRLTAQEFVNLIAFLLAQKQTRSK